ncbi:MAG: FtsX-like permease family protein [Acidimicrobiales bacterium]
MNLESKWLAGLVRRRRGRLASLTAGIALTVGFLGALGSFFVVASANMTRQALLGSPVDWQVQLAPGVAAATGLETVRTEPGVTRALVVNYGNVLGFSCQCGGTLQTTGSGKALGLPGDYAATFPKELRYLIGHRHGALLAQQAASNLHATVGSTIQLRLPQGPSISLRVDGIIDLPAADSLFQVVGAPPSSALQAPPDNVVLLPTAVWHRLYANVTAPGATTIEVHVRLGSVLPSDPASAYADALARAHHLEARFAGQALVGNNVAALLDAARNDALYANLLFLFLGVPGVVLAILLTAVLGASGGDRRRREQALLRLRGATPRRIVRLAVAEGLMVGVAGSIVGLVIATLLVRLTFHAANLRAAWPPSTGWMIVAVVTGVAVAVVCLAVPAWRDSRTITIAQERAVIGHGRWPLWARLYLDVVALALAAVVFLRSASNGYQVVVAPEGVATSTVDTTVFLAPLLLWIGTALLCWRISWAVLARAHRPLVALVRPWAGPLAGVAVASMRRQRVLLSRGLVILAITSSFAVSTAVFNTTYAAQSRVDAALTNGADVAVTAPGSTGLPGSLASRLSSVTGVSSVASMMHRYAYVGADLQDLYGVNPTRIGRTVHVVDSFFTGLSARGAMAALASRPDAILVSLETAQTYLLTPGTMVRLRLQFASDHRYHAVPFHFVGVVREFPTAPHDSFFVTNARYVARVTGDPSSQILLIRTNGPPPPVARAISSMISPLSGITVRSVDQQLATTLTGLSAVDVSGLTRLELTLALLLAAAAAGIVLALGLAERRRTFAIAVAIGAKTRQLSTFVWSEAVFILSGGVVFGSLTGWLLANTITKLLTGVFDPPPDHLSIPLTYVGLFLAVTLLSGVGAVLVSLRATRRPQMEVLRDL